MQRSSVVLSTVAFVLLLMLIMIARKKSQQERALRLWTDHMFWTRVYIAETFSNRPTDMVLARLMKNQEDIGGKDAELVQLLKEHIQIAGQIVADTMAKKDTTDGLAQWRANALKLADKMHMPQTDMLKHLSTTVGEVTAMSIGDFQCVKQTDETLDQVWHMAKMMK